MRIHNLVFGTIATLFTFAHGSGYTAPAYTLASNNQSLLFGYQLYGSHIYNASAVCKDVNVASHGIWDLSTWMIQRKPLLLPSSFNSLGTIDRADCPAGAFCDQLSITPANRSSIPFGWENDIVKKNVRFFSTGLFITQLWYAFDLSQYRKSTQQPRTWTQNEDRNPTRPKETQLTPQKANSTNTSIAASSHPFAHLCAVLQPSYLEAFDLDSARIRSTFCAAANLTSLPPTPVAKSAISHDVLASYSDTISTLFAYLLITSSRNSVEADEICVKAMERQAEVENSG